MKKQKIIKKITAGVLTAAILVSLPGWDQIKVSAKQEGSQMEMAEQAGKIHDLYAGTDLSEAGKTAYGTKKLIVKTDQEDFDLQGAEEKISLENGIYVLSYQDAEQAEKACGFYQRMEGIDFAEADSVVKAQEEGEKKEENEEDSVKKDMESMDNEKEDSIKKEKEDSESFSQNESSEEEEKQEIEVPDETIQKEVEEIPEDDIVRVVLLDTGVKNDIGNLSSYIQETGINASGSGSVGSASDDNSHGTAMAQVIVSAVEENGKNADNMKILPVKVLDESGYGTTLTVYLGMKAAMEQGADIICLGLSGKAESKLIESTVDEAYDAGITVIAAAGNNASDVSEYVPGSCEKAVVITSAKNQKEAVEDSNYGNTVDFSTYGTKEVLDLAGRAQTVSGTSMACAYVTGVAASLEKGMSCEEVEAGLLKRAVPVAEESLIPYLGKGIIGEVPEKEEADKKEAEISQDSAGKDEVHAMEPVSSLKAASSDAIYDPDAKKTGYHLEQDGKSVVCMHSMDHSAYISCEGSGLNPDKSYLKGKVTSSSKKLTITSQTITKCDQNTMASFGTGYGLISPYILKAYVSGGDPNGHTLAAPYTCPDGNAGYAYYRHYFSYCDETEQWYFVGAEHVWLGCSGGDVGFIEKHPRDFSHTITKYKFVANEYKIQFDGNGATSGSMKDLSMTYDKAKKLTANAYKKTGYIFTGWNTKKNGSGDSYDNKQSVKNLTSKNGGTVTLYAQWEPITYTVQYNGNGATSGSTAASTHIYDKEKKLTKNGFERSFGVTYHDNYDDDDTDEKTVSSSFQKWNTAAGGAGTFYSNRQSVKNLTTTNGATVNLYAQWKDSTVTLPSRIREGYDLLGWSTSKNATAADSGYTAGSMVTVSSNKTLYAVWKIKTYTIQYDANGGIGTMENGTKTHFQAYTIKDNAFIHNGYDFVEWNTKADGTGDSYAEGAVYKEEKSVTLYAIWKEHFNVAYIGNGQTQGTDFIDAGEDGYGHSEKLDYTFDDNKEEDEAEKAENKEEHFKKTETAAYMDDETGETIKQEIEGTVVDWAMVSEDTEGTYDAYGLRGTIPGEQLILNAQNTPGAFTIGSPNSDFGKSNDIVATAMSSARGSTAASATIPSLGGAGTVYNGTPYVNMYAVWDMGPVIEAYDRYYTLEEAQNGFIKEKELLDAAKATDKEVKSDTNEEGRLKNFVDEENQTSFTVIDYQAEEFTELMGSAVISVTYRAEDAVGNVTRKIVKIHVVDGHDSVIDGRDIGTDPDEGKVRFISKNYLNTLKNESVWINNPEYAKTLKDTVGYKRNNPEKSDPVPLFGDSYSVDVPGTGDWNTTPQSVWTFTSEQVKKAKEFVDQHGPSDYKEENALKEFYNKFSSCRN